MNWNSLFYVLRLVQGISVMDLQEQFLLEFINIIPQVGQKYA